MNTIQETLIDYFRKLSALKYNIIQQKISGPLNSRNQIACMLSITPPQKKSVGLINSKSQNIS